MEQSKINDYSETYISMRQDRFRKLRNSIASIVGAVLMASCAPHANINLESRLQKNTHKIEQKQENNQKNQVCNQYLMSLLNDRSSRYYLQKSLSESTRYEDYIKRASRETGINEALLRAVMHIESNIDLRARSDAGAAGPMQLMPETAREVGLNVNQNIDERYSPKSIGYASKYLDELIKKYNNMELGLVAYNHGPTKTDKLIQKYGSNLRDIKPHLPKETRNYLTRVFSVKSIFENPREYGLSFTKKPLFSEELKKSRKHELRNGETLSQLSRKYNVPVDEIKELNPHIKNYSYIAKGMTVNIPRT